MTSGTAFASRAGMRILLINWAPIWDGASFGGGVNGYVQALALALVERGHDVTSLFGGLVCVPDRQGGTGSAEPFLRRHDDWLGIRIFEVINSPVLAPSLSQFADPAAELSQPALERLVGDVFGRLRPDIVHFHNLEGFSAGCITVAKSSGARVIYSLHNYHTLCSQVTLTRDHRWACHDFDEGRACERCLSAPPPEPGLERRRRIAEHLGRDPDSLMGRKAALQREWGGFKHELSWPKRLVVRSARVLKELRRTRAAARDVDRAMSLPGRAVDHAADYTQPMPRPGGQRGELRGQAPAILAQRRPEPKRDPRDRPVLNIIQPSSCGAAGENGEANAYARRRREMVRALSACDRVLAVSTFVARKFESMGVPRDRLTVMPIGTRINGLVRQNKDVIFDPPAFPAPAGRAEAGATSAGRPIRLVFLGYNHFNKGLPLLAEALESLDAARLARLDISLFALGGETIEWRFRRMEPRLARLHMTHGYQFHDIPWCLGGKDLTYVGSTWWDPAPQTVFESFACGVPVLGAELGGIPDFVKHGVNGLLFRGNDPADLTRKLAAVIDAPWTLTRLRANVRPPKDITTHAGELEQLYRGGRGSNAAGPTPAGRAVAAAEHPSAPARNGRIATLTRE